MAEPSDLTWQVLAIIAVLLSLASTALTIRGQLGSKRRDAETRSLLQVEQSLGCKVDHAAISELLKGLAAASQKQSEATAGLSLAVMQLSLQTANDAKSAEARHNEMLRMMAQAESRHVQVMQQYVEALQAIRGTRT